MSNCAAPCSNCSASTQGLERLGIRMQGCDYVVALAGNPNTGKSTVFNQLTGLRQHTGNWPGKTISRAEGAFGYKDKRFKLVDLPGTYSLLSSSPDEEIARNALLFTQPDVTVIVADATALERNLNLILQVIQVTPRTVLCLNLIDEAEAHGIRIDTRGLARELGIPVVETAARKGQGVEELISVIAQVAEGKLHCQPRTPAWEVPGLQSAVDKVAEKLRTEHSDILQPEWVALRLLDGDNQIRQALTNGDLTKPTGNPHHPPSLDVRALIEEVESLRWDLPQNLNDLLTESIYGEAAGLAERNTTRPDSSARLTWQHRLDWLLTSRWTGFPVMFLIFAAVLWITIEGANVPSSMLADVLIGGLYPLLNQWADSIHLSPWISGLTIDGMYLSAAWVVSVMLPPMAIFFPLFTILEDFGYLPRVAFNMDKLFEKVGAHGKQALTMSMGLGCNAAGVIACRIIDSPRERLIAILTNNFSLCNGRWPTQILLATIFLGALVPESFSGVAAALGVIAVASLGFAFAFLSSWMLSHTFLRGESSTFSLELPPYRPPSMLRTLYTSLIDRTLFVLWRAVVFAIPAGAVIWLTANIPVGDASLAEWLIHGMDPMAQVFGLTGVILLAYIIAIPANEIVIPTILMLTVMSTGLVGMGEGAGVMFETDQMDSLTTILKAGGWTTLTAISLMLFSLLHNPCSTTIYTIYKETGSWKWTGVATFMPLIFGFIACAALAAFWRLLT